MKEQAWIIVADGDRARILKIERPGVLIQIDCLHDPLGRAKEQDLTSDRSGRRVGAGITSRQMEPETYPHKKELVEFARQLSHYLEKAKRASSFKYLYLVADPKLLGILRQELDPCVKQAVAEEFAKNLATEPLEKIWDQLHIAV